jgi:hypothetical protein
LELVYLLGDSENAVKENTKSNSLFRFHTRLRLCSFNILASLPLAQKFICVHDIKVDTAQDIFILSISVCDLFSEALQPFSGN